MAAVTKVKPSRHTTRAAAPREAVAKAAKPGAQAPKPAKPGTRRGAGAVEPPAKPAQPAQRAKAAKAAPPKPAKAARDEARPRKDTFRMPPAEFDRLRALKQRARALGRPAKKSELLRAGLQLLAAGDDAALLAALGTLGRR